MNVEVPGLVVARHHWRRQSPFRHLIVLRPHAGPPSPVPSQVGSLEAARKVASPTPSVVWSGLASQLPPLAVTSP
jgi:hypothetical protein